MAQLTGMRSLKEAAIAHRQALAAARSWRRSTTQCLPIRSLSTLLVARAYGDT